MNDVGGEVSWSARRSGTRVEDESRTGASAWSSTHSATRAQAKKALCEEEKAKIYFIPHGPHQLALAQ
jgi:hypothetical protein